MSNKNKVAINIETNSQKAVEGINKITQQLNKMSKEIKGGTLGQMAKLGSAVSGVKAAFDIATKAIKSAVAAVKDISEAYKTQAKAEVQLESAAKNSPYLNSSAVSRLKAYASELQKIGTVGDETLIPMMAELAAAGRTENEIQQIMAAALDASASGAISLDAAVKGLNMSYSGQIGTLGRTLPMLKGLTAEELKQGKAVSVVAEAYKGMAEETAKAVGSTEKLKNAWGDFKEIVGKGISIVLSPLENTVTNIINKVNDGLSKSEKTEEKSDSLLKDAGFDIGKNNLEEMIKNAKAKQKQLEEEKKQLLQDQDAYNMAMEKIAIDSAQERVNKVLNITKESTKKELNNAADIISQAVEKFNNISSRNFTDEIMAANLRGEEFDLEKAIKEDLESRIFVAAQSMNVEMSVETMRDILTITKTLNPELKDLVKSEEEYNKGIAEQKKIAEELEKQKADEEFKKNRDAATEKYNKIIEKRDAALAKLEREAEIKGETVDAQSRLNVEMSAYLEMAEEPLLAKRTEEQKKLVTELADEIARAADEQERLKNSEIAKKNFTQKAALKDDGSQEMIKVFNQIDELTDAYNEYVKTIENGCVAQLSAEKALKDKISEIWDEYYDEQKRKREAADAERIEQIQKVVTQVNSIISQATSAISGFAGIARQAAEDEANAELLALEKQKKEGLITEEEYNKKKEQIEREAAALSSTSSTTQATRSRRNRR